MYISDRRSHNRDLLDAVITKLLQRITLSATIECRRDVAQLMRRVVFTAYTIGFIIGVAVTVCLPILR